MKNVLAFVVLIVGFFLIPALAQAAPKQCSDDLVITSFTVTQVKGQVGSGPEVEVQASWMDCPDVETLWSVFDDKGNPIAYQMTLYTDSNGDAGLDYFVKASFHPAEFQVCDAVSCLEEPIN